MFADLVGFTTAAQSRDPEEVRELLGSYFDVCRRLVELYGGTLEKFIGDAVMAVWGTPVANEDDAERAVRSALDLVQAVQALGDEVHIPELRARAAVMTGEAAVTLGAVGQGMVAGDLVNTASRLQSIAPAGAVVVGDSVRRLTEASTVYEDFGTHELKGRDEPVHAWQALRVVSARGGAQRASAFEPPFVGRDRELRLVKELFHAAVDESRAHLVSVTGIAGIGKSRLAWEFFKYVDGVAGRVRWHTGRCLAYGDGVTYWALAEMVRTRAGIVEAEGGEPALSKLRKALEESIPDADERRWLEPRLAQLIGLQEPGASERQDLFAAWRRFYERLSEEMPTVMVFEDMQWADPSLVEFIDYLLDWSRDHRIFIVTLGRAGEPQRGSARGHTALHLESLSARVMEEMITAVVPGLPRELVEQVMDRAEGVPLYAVETIRMLIDRGLLVRDGMTYHPAGAIESLEVPDSLHTLIAARLDGLEVAERQLLKQGAVLGKTFSAAALAAVSGRPQPEVDAVLASLLRKEVLSVRSDPRSPERGQFAFLQDLVRQVAYETMSRRDRRELHLRVAAYLEASYGGEQEEIVEVLAAHYLEAYREIPDADDAASIKERACRMLTRAGDRASALAAAAEAQTYYERAIELAGSPLEKARLDERAGSMAWRRGLIQAALLHFDTARAAFEAAGDRQGAASVETRSADILVALGQLRQGADRLGSAYEAIAGDEPSWTLGMLAAQLGRMLALMTRFDEARPYVERALEVAEELRLPDVLSHAFNTKAVALQAVDRYEEATLLQRHALEVALRNELWAAAFRSFNNLGVLLYYTDRLREGIELFDEAFAHGRRLGDRSEMARARSSQLGYMEWLGMWDECLAAATEAEDVGGPELLHAPWFTNRWVSAVTVLCERGEVVQARALAERLAPSLVSDQPDTVLMNVALLARVVQAEGAHREALQMLLPLWRANPPKLSHPAGKTAWSLMIECAFSAGDLDVVNEMVKPVLALRPGQTPPSLAALRLRYAARIDAALGRSDGVEDRLGSAVEILRDAEMPFHEAGTRLELAEWLVARDERDRARPQLAAARVIFERLRARPSLERLMQVEAS